MTRIARWLFRKAALPLLSTRVARVWDRLSPPVPPAPFLGGVERLEAREQTGNLMNGLVAAAFGGPFLDPIVQLAAAVGDLAMVAAIPDPVTAGPPVTVTSGGPLTDLQLPLDPVVLPPDAVWVGEAPSAGADESESPLDDLSFPTPDDPASGVVLSAPAEPAPSVEPQFFPTPTSGVTSPAEGYTPPMIVVEGPAIGYSAPSTTLGGSSSSGEFPNGLLGEGGNSPVGVLGSGGPNSPGGEGGSSGSQSGDADESDDPVPPRLVGGPSPLVLVVPVDPTAAEGGETAGAESTAAFRIGRVGPVGGELTVQFLLKGSAQLGGSQADYTISNATPVSGIEGRWQVTFGIDERTKVLVVTPSADETVEGDEEVRLVLVPHANDQETLDANGQFTTQPVYQIDQVLYTAKATIADHTDPPSDTGWATESTPVVGVRALDPNASEAGRSSALFEFARAGDPESATLPLTVHFRLTGNPLALLGPDFNLLNVTTGQAVTEVSPGRYATLIPQTERVAYLRVELTGGQDDALLEGPEGIVVELLPPPGQVSGWVWEDGDGDALWASGETPPLGTVDVELYTASDQLVAVTTTNADGFYAFSNVVPDTYKVKFTPSPDYTFTWQETEEGEPGDSDVNPSTGFSHQFTLTGSEAVDDVWAGVVRRATVGGVGWEDLDADGEREQDGTSADEPLLASVTVALVRGDTTLGVTTTDATGGYEFADQRPGHYTLEYTLPADYHLSPMRAEAAGPDRDSDPELVETEGGGGSSPPSPPAPVEGVRDITVYSGTNEPRLDVGGYRLAAVGDRVWYDTDWDGVQDAGEAGVIGVSVTLRTNFGELVGTTATGTNGDYQFTHLKPGDYRLYFTPPVGYRGTLPLAGADRAADSDGDRDGGTRAFALASGVTDATRDFGLVEVGLGDYVWEDTDADGVQGEHEIGVGGVIVALVNLDTETTLVAVSQPDGFYGFSDPPGGEYQLAFTPPPGFAFTLSDQTPGDDEWDSDAAADGWTAPFTLLPGEVAFGWDAGLVRPGSIGGRAWTDPDADGVRADGEPVRVGTVVTLLEADGETTITTAATAADGTYLFAGLYPGDYVVRFDKPSQLAFSPEDQGGDDTRDSDVSATGVVRISVGSGVQVENVDAGVVPARLGDFVWEDTNADGVQDEGESGLAGLTVELLDGGGVVVATTVSGGDGQYHFADRATGSYRLRFTAPTGYSFSPQGEGDDDTDSDPAPATGETALFTYTEGQPDATRDAGLSRPNRVSGRVWEDSDGDGQQGDDEPGRAGVPVVLEVDDGTVTLTAGAAVTGDGGGYTFVGLPVGTYRVRFSTPGGTAFTQQDAGADDANDSDPDPLTGLTEWFGLAAGTQATGWDAGLVAVGAVSGFVYADLSGDGGRDEWEPGLGGVSVVLSKQAGEGWAVVGTATTNSTGYYRFDGQTEGVYRLTEYTPAGWDDGDDTPGTTGGWAEEPDTLTNIQLAAGGHSFANAFGERPQAGTISGTVYLDANTNGYHDPSDPGLNGVTVRLWEETAGGPVLVTSTATDAHGRYHFGGLTEGTYAVEQVQPAGYRDGPETVGSAGGELVTNDRISAIPLTAGGFSYGNEFGEQLPLSDLSGWVYFDANDDGVKQTGETGLQGVTVSLFRETEHPYSPQFVTATTTGWDGQYTFAGLEPGLYRVVEQQPAGYADGIDTPGVAGGIVIGADAVGRVPVAGGAADGPRFGERPLGYPTVGGVRGAVYADLNWNGVRDVSEPGIPGVTVGLFRHDWNGLTSLAWGTTGADGGYAFGGLPAGYYAVGELTPAGWTDGAEAVGSTGGVLSPPDRIAWIPLPDGVVSWGNLFGELPPPGELSGSVYVDTDNDGVRDPGEGGIEGVTVTLLREQGGATSTLSVTTTGTGGAYSFGGLVPGGGYEVRETQPSGYTDGQEAAGSTGGDVSVNDRIRAITVPTGGVSYGNTFGELTQSPPPPPPPPPPTDGVGDFVWHDLDADGVQDAGEPGVGDVTVELLDGLTRAVVATTQSDPTTGAYWFAGVPGGSYRVRVPAGQFDGVPAFSPKDVGGDATDSDANPDGETDVFTYTAGAVTAVDIGMTVKPPKHVTNTMFASPGWGGMSSPEWGGTSGPEWGLQSGGAATGDRPYQVGSARTARVELADDDSRLVVSSVTLAPAAPAAGTTGTALGMGALATFTDTDTTRTVADFTAEIAWGDGTTSPGTVVAVAGSPGSFSVTGQDSTDPENPVFGHVYAKPDGYPVTVTLTANYWADPTVRTGDPLHTRTLTATTTLTATAPAGLVTLNPLSVTGVVGTPVSNDPSGALVVATAQFAVGVVTPLTRFVPRVWFGEVTTAGGWVDAFWELSGGVYQVRVTPHVYPTGGAHLVRVVVHDTWAEFEGPGGDVTASATSLVTVGDPAWGGSVPTPTAVHVIEGAEGATVGAGVRVEWAGAPVGAITEAVVVWGDGVEESAAVGFANGAVTVETAGHVYRQPGVYPVTVAFAVGSGWYHVGSTAVITAATVTAGLLLQLESPPAGRSAGDPVRVAEFTSADPSDAGDDFRATVTFGDGRPARAGWVFGSGGNYWVGVDPQYATAGRYGLSVRVTKPGNTAASAALSSTVVVGDAREGDAYGDPLRPGAGGRADGRPGQTVTVVREEQADSFADVRAWGRWDTAHPELWELFDVAPGASGTVVVVPGGTGSGGGSPEPTPGGSPPVTPDAPRPIGVQYHDVLAVHNEPLDGTAQDWRHNTHGVVVGFSEPVKGNEGFNLAEEWDDGEWDTRVVDAPFAVADGWSPARTEPLFVGVSTGELTALEFTDRDPSAGPTSRYTVIVDWGDGTRDTTSPATPALTVVSLGNGRFRVQSTGHAYTHAGDFAVSVLVLGTQHDATPADPNASLLAASFRFTARLGIMTAGQRRDERDRATWLPAGPSGEVSANTGAVRLSHALDLDQSPGTAVGYSPHLVYNSATVAPRPVIETQLALGAEPVTSVVAQLTWRPPNRSQATPLPPPPPPTTTTETFTLPQNWDQTAPLTLAVRPATVTESGVYGWTLTLTVHRTDLPDLVYEADGLAQVVNNDASPFGAGWWLDEWWRVEANADGKGGALLVYGTGESRHFSLGADKRFVSPPGEFGQLEKVGDGFVYRDQFGEVRTFNANGRQTQIIDRHGLSTWFNPDAGGRLEGVVSRDGHATEFEYLGDPADSALVTVKQSGGRWMNLHVNERQLTDISDADGSYRLLSYSEGLVEEERWGTSRTTYHWQYGLSTGFSLGRPPGGELEPPAEDVRYTLRSAAGRGFWTTTPPTNPVEHSAGVLVDPREASTAYTVDLVGRTSLTRFADGNTTRAFRDDSGLVRQFTDQRKYTTGYGYDTRGNLAAVLYPDKSTRSYGYGVNSQLAWEVNGRGELTTHLLNAAGDVTDTIDPLGYRTHYEWQLSGPLVGLLQAVTDARNYTTTYQYDGSRRLLYEFRPDTVVVQHLYDAAGNPRDVVSGGRVSRTVYDKLNRLSETYAYSPAGELVVAHTWAYNPQDQITREVDARQNRTDTAYNSRGEVTSVTEGVGTPAQRVTTYGYGPTEGWASVTSPAPGGSGELTETTRTQFDQLGRPVAVTSGYGTSFAHTRQSAYDAAGNLKRTWASQYYDTQVALIAWLFPGPTDGLFVENRFVYDEMNRVEEQTIGATAGYAVGPWQVPASAGITTTTWYDPDGRPDVTFAPAGHSVGVGSDPQAQVVTVTDYDPLGRVVRVTEASGTHYSRTTKTEYDGDGNPTLRTDAEGRKTKTVYDGLGRVASIIEAFGTPLQRTTGYRYDAWGNLEFIDAPRLYDADAVPTGQDRFVTTKYEYDWNGRRTKATQGQNLTPEVWDPAADGSRVQLLPHARPITVFAYNLAGDLTSVTDPLGRKTAYLYDVFGRKVEEQSLFWTDLPGDTPHPFADGLYRRGTKWEYDDTGRVVSTTLAGSPQPRNGTDRWATTTTFDYDLLGRLSDQYDGTDAGSNLAGYLSPHTHYVYDAFDRPISLTDPNGTVTVTSYTPLGHPLRVVEASGTPVARTTDFTYDAAGRVRTRTVSGRDTTLPAAFGTVSHQTAYTYDPLGRVRSTLEIASDNPFTRTSAYQYDGTDNKTAVVDPLGRRTEYGYDGLNRQVSVTVAALLPSAAALQMHPTWVAGGTVRDTSPRTSRYGFDAADNMLWEARARDADANPTTSSAARDVSVAEHKYDGLNRRAVTVEGPNVTADELTALGHKRPVNQWQYDIGGRVVLELRPGQTDQVASAVEHEFELIGLVGGPTLDDVTTISEGVYRYNTQPPSARYTPLRLQWQQFDGQGNVTEVIGGVVVAGAEGQVGEENRTKSQFTYDPLGRLAFSRQFVDIATDVSLNTFRRYDAKGNLLQEVQQQSNIETLQLPSRQEGHTGELVDATREQKVRLARSTRYEYDPLGRVSTTFQASDITPQQHFSTLAGIPPLFYVDENEAITDLGLQTGEKLPVWKMQYDINNQAVLLTNPYGVQTKTLHDGFGQKIAVQEAWKLLLPPEGKNWTAEDLGILSDPTAGPKMNWVYDQGGQLVRVVNAVGVATEFRYDDRGRMTRRIEAVGLPVERHTVTDFGFHDGSVQVTTGVARHEKLNSSKFEYTFAHPLKTSTEYDVYGRKRKVSQGLTASSREYGKAQPWETYRYDAGSRLVGVDRNASTFSVERIAGTKYVYDALNRVIMTIEGIDRLNYPENPPAWQEQSREASARKVSRGYDSTDNVVRMIDGTGVTKVVRFDNAAHAVAEEVDHGVARYGRIGSEQSYSAFGEKIGTKSLGKSKQKPPPAYTEYDRLGRVSIVYPHGIDGESVKNTYDATGNLRTTTEKLTVNYYLYPDHPTDKSTATTVRTTVVNVYFDPLGRPVRKVDTNGAVTLIRYNKLGQQDLVVRAGKPPTSAKAPVTTDGRYFLYDAHGQLQYEFWMSKTKVGNEVKSVRVSSVSIFLYDANGQLKVTDRMNNPPVANMAAYPADGAVPASLPGNFTPIPGTTRIRPDKSAAYVQNNYDWAGRLQYTFAVFNHQVGIAYRADGLVVQLTDTGSENDRWVQRSEYDLAGRLITRNLSRTLQGVSQKFFELTVRYKDRKGGGKLDLVDFEWLTANDNRAKQVELNVQHQPGTGREIERDWRAVKSAVNGVFTFSDLENIETTYHPSTNLIASYNQVYGLTASKFEADTRTRVTYTKGQPSFITTTVTKDGVPRLVGSERMQYDSTGNPIFGSKAEAENSTGETSRLGGGEPVYNDDRTIRTMAYRHSFAGGTDKAGIRTHYVYDGGGNLTGTTTYVGHVQPQRKQFIWRWGDPEFAQTPHRTTTYKYDTLGRLIKFEGLYGLIDKNELRIPALQILPETIETHMFYVGDQLFADVDVVVQSANHPLNSPKVRYVYGPSGELVANIDSDGDVRFYLTDSQKSVVQVVSSSGQTLKRLVYAGNKPSTEVFPKDENTGVRVIPNRIIDRFELGGEMVDFGTTNFRADERTFQGKVTLKWLPVVTNTGLQRVGSQWMLPDAGRTLTGGRGGAVNPYALSEHVDKTRAEQLAAITEPSEWVREHAADAGEAVFGNPAVNLGVNAALGRVNAGLGWANAALGAAGVPAGVTRAFGLSPFDPVGKMEARGLGAGLWDRAYGQSVFGMAESLLPRDYLTGKAVNPFTLRGLNTLGDGHWYTNAGAGLSAEYDGYRGAGFEWHDALGMTTLGMVPTVAPGVEFQSGTSVRGSTFGERLTGDERLLRTVDHAIDTVNLAAAVALCFLPGGQMLGAVNAASTATRGLMAAMRGLRATGFTARTLRVAFQAVKGAARAYAGLAFEVAGLVLPIPDPRAVKSLPRLLDGAHALVNKGLSTVIHDWMPNSRFQFVNRMHDPAAKFFNRIGFNVCFAAGTPLAMAFGTRVIEDIRAGDLIQAQDEHDPNGLVVAKVVEEVFVREGLVWHLRAGGRLIRTTAEHPFYTMIGGWTAVNRLQVGDLLRTQDGGWVAVEEVADTGVWETVYNLRVADYHTYFVGAPEWGFAVWAHNATCTATDVEQAVAKLNHTLPPEVANAVADLHNQGAWGAARGVKAALEQAGLDPATATKVSKELNDILNQRDALAASPLLRDTRALADQVQQQTTTKTRPQAVTIVETADGTRGQGQSARGGATPIEPVVEAAYNAVPIGERSAHHMMCGEVYGMSDAVRNGGTLHGAKFTSVNLDGASSTAGRHGLSKAPCSSCSHVARALGMTFVRD